MHNAALSTETIASQRATDADLVARAANGDELAFEAIMRRHNRLLFRTARSILKNDAETEDALQEAYLRAWRALAGFRADSKLSTWLVRIVINESLGRLRRHGAQVIPLDAAMEWSEHQTEAWMEDDPNQRPTGSRCVAKCAVSWKPASTRCPMPFAPCSCCARSKS